MAFIRHVAERTFLLERSDNTVVVLTQTDEVGPICWGFFWYRDGDFFGFRNELGEIITPPVYLEVSNFDKTWHAAVRSETGWGFINQEGKATTRLIYDKVWWYKDGYVKVQKEGNILYLNKYGLEPSDSYMNNFIKNIWEEN